MQNTLQARITYPKIKNIPEGVLFCNIERYEGGDFFELTQQNSRLGNFGFNFCSFYGKYHS